LINTFLIGGAHPVCQLACLSREAARWASVRGSDWHKETGLTYPTKSDILQNGVLPLAVGMNPNNLTLQVQCLDQVTGQVVDWDTANKYPRSVNTANQGVANRVQATVTYQWTPQLFLVGAINLKSTCVLPMSF
jgi:hypothetical protein